MAGRPCGFLTSKRLFPFFSTTSPFFPVAIHYTNITVTSEHRPSGKPGEVVVTTPRFKRGIPRLRFSIAAADLLSYPCSLVADPSIPLRTSAVWHCCLGVLPCSCLEPPGAWDYGGGKPSWPSFWER